MKSQELAGVLLNSAAAVGTSLVIIAGAGTITTALLGKDLDLHTIAYYAGLIATIGFTALFGGGLIGAVCAWITSRSSFGKRSPLAQELGFFVPAFLVAAGYVTWAIVNGIFADRSSSDFTNTLSAVAGIAFLAIGIYSLRDFVAKRREAESQSTMKRIVTESISDALAQREVERARNHDS